MKQKSRKKRRTVNNRLADIEEESNGGEKSVEAWELTMSRSKRKFNLAKKLKQR